MHAWGYDGICCVDDILTRRLIHAINAPCGNWQSNFDSMANRKEPLDPQHAHEADFVESCFGSVFGLVLKFLFQLRASRNSLPVDRPTKAFEIGKGVLRFFKATPNAGIDFGPDQKAWRTSAVLEDCCLRKTAQMFSDVSFGPAAG